ncbi:MAG: class I tRNA ligase family protein, partial [Candidatus Paceibacterota bacterium]
CNFCSDPKVAHNLTEIGRKQVEESAKSIKNLQIDLIITSPFVRTLETSEIVRKIIGLSNDQVVIDNRAHELDTGIWNGKKITEYTEKFIHHEDRFVSRLEGGETYLDVKKRMGDLLYDTDGKYIDQNILIITHELPSLLLISAARGLDRVSSITLRGSGEFINNAEIKKVDFSILPHNTEYELDLHRPHIDNVTLNCKCGGSMKRIKEVMDVWFDSGAMPFAQDHYPFEGKKLFAKMSNYPADYISEAIDQTRGWFYTLHAIGTLMSNGKAYKNVICLGHILDKEGKKMSKSIGNVVNPQIMMDKYGADALRFWMYSINQPGDSKNFDEKTVDEVVKKVFNLATNVTAFYKMYDTNKIKNESQKVLASKNILDMWIVARMNQLIEITTKGLDNYSFFEPTRAIRDFIADLSQWYVRRSRDRFKEDGEDKDNALETTKYILITLAKVMAPFAPFFAEWLYGEVGGEKESVHLEEWPKKGKIDRQLIVQMALARDISSKGLEARMGVKINVRQPLASLKIKNNKKFDVNCDKGLANLIKDEVNVKEVLFDKSIVGEVEIDTNITPELKEEGDLRELMRKIQDMRKEKGLSIGNMAKLTIPIDMKILVYKYIDELKKATGLTSITVGDSLRLEV